MTAANWIQLLVPLISIIVAIISAAFSYYFTKEQQIKAEERKLKTEAYIKLIEALSNNVLLENVEDARRVLADARNRLLLIASPQVVKCLCEFTDYIAADNPNVFSQTEHDRLLTELIKSLRIDLYGKKRINEGYPSVRLSGINRRGTNSGK